MGWEERHGKDNGSDGTARHSAKTCGKFVVLHSAMYERRRLKEEICFPVQTYPGGFGVSNPDELIPSRT